MTVRASLGKMQNPIRGFLHGGAAIASLVGMILMLVIARGSTRAMVSSLVFGVSMVLMYTISALYHSIPWTEISKIRMRRADHSMIYLVVAATFTPVGTASLDGPSMWASLGIIWAIAITGIFLKLFVSDVRTGLSITLQMVMGWTAIVWMPAIYRELGAATVALILGGGLSYTVGAILFSKKIPTLFPRTFGYHEMFHILVIVGSILHFIAVFSFAIPHMTG